MRPILFDFNGTLFFDHDINEEAWRQTINELSKGSIDFDEVYRHYIGARNNVFVEGVFRMLGKTPTAEEIEWWSLRKETKYYQSYCVEHKRNQLAPGAEEFLDWTREKKIPINLCTASIKENVDFYFSNVDLGRWFDRDLVAYDDGIHTSKTDMYQTCAKNIGVDIGDCVVIEDSPGSIRQAIESGCRNILTIGDADIPAVPQLRQHVEDFRQIDKEIIEGDVSRETF